MSGASQRVKHIALLHDPRSLNLPLPTHPEPSSHRPRCAVLISISENYGREKHSRVAGGTSTRAAGRPRDVADSMAKQTPHLLVQSMCVTVTTPT